MLAALERGRKHGDMRPALSLLGGVPWQKKDIPKKKAASDNKSQQQEKQNSTKPLIRATPFVIRDPAQIPKREFLHGTHYIRKYLSATFRAGGAGKSAHAITEALSMVTGRPLLSDSLAPHRRVWYVNAEDPADEIERRIAASIKHFKITEEQIDGRLFADSGRDQEFVIVKDINRQTFICQPVIDAIIAEVKARQIDVLIVDPFVSTHTVDEKDNTKIQQVAAAWVRVAQEANCSVELIHHVRKTSEEITADDGRGAGALKDKARSVRVINLMTKSEASGAGVQPSEALSYFKVEFGKTNMTRRGGMPMWRKFVSVKLGNGGTGNLASTQGDEIGVVDRWDWPSASSVAEEIDPDTLDGIKSRLSGSDYRESPQSPQWAGHAIGEILGIDTDDKGGKAKIKRIIDVLIGEGQFSVEVRNDESRRLRKCIVPVFCST